MDKMNQTTGQEAAAGSKPAPEAEEEVTPTIKEMGDSTRAEIDQLRAEVAQSRRETEATISAIRDRLAPDNLKDQAQEKIREATIGKARNMAQSAGNKTKHAASSVYGSVKDYILPSTLISIGVAWLLTRATGHTSGAEENHYGDEASEGTTMRDYPGPAGDMQADQPRPSGETLDDSTAQQLKDKAADLATGTKEKLESATEKAGQKAGRVREQTRRTAENVGSQARRHSRTVARKAVNTTESNPLAMAGALFAVGSALGFLIPQTRMEDEWMGETSERVMERAKKRGRDTMERVEVVAKEAGKTAADKARQEAHKQGLASQDAGGADDVLETAKR